MKKRKIINWLCLTGILSLIFYILHDVVGTLNYPGYNWTREAVSDLTATDSPVYGIAHSLSLVYGILSCLCSLLVCILVKKEEKKTLRLGVYLFTTMNFISAIGYSLFPLSSKGYDGSFQSFMHVYVITIAVVLLSIISLILISVGAFKSKKKLLGTLSIVALLLMFFGAAGSGILPKSVFGIVERFSTYSAVVFTAILGIYGFNKIEKN
ncbi:MAG: DUF998 domain-containing protein [Bacilli bacterium]|nr:DUF998 domain-containing protein [Bacilli bacterium]